MAYTEFYCDASTGSNVNGGSDAGTVTYTSTNGNWSTVTNIFTPTDGSNPATAGVTVGQFASLYVDGATVAVYIARVTAVQNAANGTITVSATARAGTPPTTSATGRSIKVGGAWKGPNAGVGFPFSLSGGSLTNATDSSGNPVRINFKNNATYSVTSGIVSGSAALTIYQGYSSTVGDGGKAEISGGTTANLTILIGVSGYSLIDFIISSTATTGSGIGIGDASTNGATYIRVVSHGHRSVGFQIGASSTAYECESYDNNKGNGSTAGTRSGFSANGAGVGRFIRCYSHDNAGSNTYGFECNSGSPVAWINCIADTNGNDGFNYLINGSPPGCVTLLNCDAYNNTGDGFGIDFSTATASVLVENCNFIKNGGKGINNTTAAGKINTGLVYNCGYGSGSQVNGGGDATLGTLIESGKITYATDVTPWNAPTTGDFSITLAAAEFAGRGSFTETDGTNTGTVGYPDIGAAAHQSSGGSAVFNPLVSTIIQGLP